MQKILNIVFLSIIFVFFFSFLRGGSAEDMFEIEKRELRDLPTLEKYTINEMPQAYTDYISDHFPLRRSIMKAASVGSYKLFGAIRSDAVVLGDNRFLFLNTMDNTSPKMDYQGLNLFTEEQIDEIKSLASRLGDKAEQRGQKVILMVVPNKEEVYSKYLPDSYNRINDLTRRKQFYQRIKDTDLEIIDITDNIKAFSQNEDDLYFLADTHWTGKGAYIGAESLLKALNIECVSYLNNNFHTGSYYESDIANLCNLYDEYKDTKDLEAEKNICDSKSDLSITFVGDSFRWRIEEYLKESFTEVNVYDHNVTQEEMMDSATDILVIEVVERNLSNITYLMQRAIY